MLCAVIALCSQIHFQFCGQFDWAMFSFERVQLRVLRKYSDNEICERQSISVGASRDQ